jgi:hypothetical protein
VVETWWSWNKIRCFRWQSGEWRKLGNYNFYGQYLPSIWVINLILRLVGRMASMGVRWCAYAVWWRDLRVRDRLEDLVIKGIMILKWILRTWEWEARTALNRSEPNSIHTRWFVVFVEEHNFFVFGLKWCHEMDWRWGLLWNTSFGGMISHSTFYSNKDLF